MKIPVVIELTFIYVYELSLKMATGLYVYDLHRLRVKFLNVEGHHIANV